MEDLTGKQLGPYQVVAPLGEGGMAAVYKAYQPGMERYVALKILPRHFASDPQFVSRFEQEAKILARLQHPHILPVFDFGQAEGYTYIVMPFLQSGDLTDLLSGPTLSLVQTRRIISQIGEALDYAHAHGLIHRDVKPSNVLLDERGNCLLTDFGIAKILEGDRNLTATGGIVGTPAYMSPEQGLGEPVDGRSDIYALGIILYEMATGRVPYQAETPLAIMIKHLNDALPLPRQLNPALPEAVERVILKALTKQPQDRYATAGAMVQALQAAIPETAAMAAVPAEHDATLVSAPGATLKTQRPQVGEKPVGSGQKWLWGVAGLVLLAIVVAGVMMFTGAAENEQPGEATAIAAPLATNEAVNPTGQPTEPAVAQGTVETPSTDTTSLPIGLYDSFEDPAFAGAWNPVLWESSFDEPCQVGQQDGFISFNAPVRSETTSCGLLFNLPRLVSIDQLGGLEARLQIADDMSGPYVNQGISIFTEDIAGSNWYAFCGLTAHPDTIEAYFEVVNYGAGADPDISQGIPAAYNRWHTFRLEVNPDPLTVACFVDDTPIGSVTPADAPALAQAQFLRSVDTYRRADSTATTYADEVRLLGGEASGPTPYDDFDNSALEGQINTELWEPWEELGPCEAAQEAGALRFTCTEPDGSGLTAVRYRERSFEEIGFVETRLKLDANIQASQGAASLLLANSLDSWAGCGLEGGTAVEQIQLACGMASFRNGEYSEWYRVTGPTVAYDTWYLVRIEMEADTGEYTFFVDGQPIGAHLPAENEQLQTAQFRAELQLYLQDGSLVTGYFDDVRIGQAE